MVVGQDVEEPAVEDDIERLAEPVDAQRVMDQKACRQVTFLSLGLRFGDSGRCDVDPSGRQPKFGREQGVLSGATPEFENGSVHVASLGEFDEWPLRSPDVPWWCHGVGRVPVVGKLITAVDTCRRQHVCHGSRRAGSDGDYR